MHYHPKFLQKPPPIFSIYSIVYMV